MSPDAIRQLLRKAGSHEREALLRKLETTARQTFKVRKATNRIAPTGAWTDGSIKAAAPCLQRPSKVSPAAQQLRALHPFDPF